MDITFDLEKLLIGIAQDLGKMVAWKTGKLISINQKGNGSGLSENQQKLVKILADDIQMFTKLQVQLRNAGDLIAQFRKEQAEKEAEKIDNNDLKIELKSLYEIYTFVCEKQIELLQNLENRNKQIRVNNG